MRFSELTEAAEEAGIDKFIIALRNHIGRASSQHVPAKLNWEAIGQMSRANGFEFAADYETFKSMYDRYPILRELVKNFNSHGVVLNVPGSQASAERKQPEKDSQAAVDKIAAGAASDNLKDSVRIDSNKQLDEGIGVTKADDDGSVAAGGNDLAAGVANQLVWRYQQLKEDNLLKKYGINKDNITRYQIQQHKAGNKITWNDAKQHFIDIEVAKEKAAKKANRKPRAPSITRREYERTVKGAGQDYLGDTMSDLRHEYPDKSPEEIRSMAQDTMADVAADMAANLLYDKEFAEYVRRQLARNMGGKSEDVKQSWMQEYVADDIYNAAMTNESFAEATTRADLNDIKKHLRESLNEKAVSKAQQKFMGMVHAAQKGENPASKEVAKVAKSMGKKDAKDFASTKHKGLPEKVKEGGFYPSKKLTKDDPIEKWIEHFQKSTNPRFKGKTPEERKKVAIGAFKSRQ